MLLSGDLSHVEITSPRLILRSTTAADGDEAFREANASIARFMSWNPPASRDEFDGILRELMAQMVIGKNLSLTVRLLETREFLGSAGLHSGDADFLETGVWIKQSAQRRGYGRETVAAQVSTVWSSLAGCGRKSCQPQIGGIVRRSDHRCATATEGRRC